MATDIETLVHQSLQGDRDAFGRIVERHQAAVSAVAYSITGNLAQSEDLAQEAFLIAWRKLNSLESTTALAPWLCGIARNLARDWVRRQAKRPTVPLDGSGQHADANTEAPDIQQERQEQADLVWGALAQLPEHYREPLVLFYRQGESVRAIAEALELSEDNVKQRLSRGRKMLRAEVESLVETTLTDTRPGKAFTASVVAALPALYGAKAGAGEVVTSSAKAAAAPVAMGALVKIALSVAAVVALLAGGVWWGMRDARTANADPATSLVSATNVSTAGETGATLRETAAPAFADSTPNPTPEATLAANTGATVTGLVVFRDTDEPAADMRVMLYQDRQEPREVTTGQEGKFGFENVPAGDYFLLASDARVEFSTMNSWRSEELAFTVAEGKPVTGVRLEVPPLGETLIGRVTDAQTGEPLSGIRIEVMQFGGGHGSGISGADGRYRVHGLEPGSWLARIDRQNPLFTSNFVKDMENLKIEEGKQAELDFAVDRGIPVHGSTVDPDGRPVADAGIDAELFPSEGNETSCLFRSDDKGKFTVWGARAGDSILLKASKDELGAHLAVVRLKQGETPDRVTLTMRARTAVSGRFVDEAGRSVEAKFWSQPHHPDFQRIWRGQTERAATFTAEMTQGMHEVMGLAKGMDLRGSRDAKELIEVGAEPIRDLVIKVRTEDPYAGKHTFSGRVVDELGLPLGKIRVEMSGDTRETMNSRFTTKTDSIGQFEFTELLDGSYRVHAYPEEPRYEDSVALSKLNPVDTPEATIVVRRAAKLRGRVIDSETGEPITRFTLESGELSSRDNEHRWGPMTPNVTSETGEFSIVMRLDERWYLWVFADGYAPKRITGDALVSGEEPPALEVKLRAGRIARGTVVDSGGAPVPRAQVFLHRGFVDGPHVLGKPVSETDSEGRFTVSSIPEDDESLYFWKRGYATTRTPIGEDMLAVLTEGGGIVGQVTIGGLPPAGPWDMHARLPDTHFVTSPEMSPDGSFRFDGLMDAGYHLQVSLGERGGDRTYFSHDGLVEVKHGEVATCDIDVPAGSAVIKGTVLDNDAAVAGARVRCRSYRLSTYVTAGEDGTYRFEHLPPGPVTLSIYVPQESQADGNPNHTVFETEITEGEILQQDLEWPG